MNPAEGIPSAYLNPLSLLPNIGLHGVLTVVVTLIFIWWALYTLIIIYHWFRYTRNTWLAGPAIAAHLFVSVWIFIYALSGS